METVIAITMPIFLVVALGFGTTRAGLFSPADMRIFGRFVISIALPALLFNAIAKRDVAEVFDAGFMGIYAVASLLVMAVGYLWFHRPRDAAGPGRDLHYGVGLFQFRLYVLSDFAAGLS